ncbi:penicillin-binding protein 2 [Nitrosophilus kaiyonis]|uniref:penicillin-binding protein 2 n=1 Tax=Nitrosophilus kaiyonis TaxID=2930200 RepID=UPI002493A70C|nr:penicillin-binding protein 2 [Nitrosophilus kaiyonis]
MRLKIVFYIFIFVWILLLSRLYFLSIKSNSYYEILAKQNMIKTEWIIPTRGEILDRNLNPLAVNKIGFKIKVAPHLSYKKRYKKLEKNLKYIKKLFSEVDFEKMLRKYKRKDSPYNHDFIEVVDFLPFEKVLPYYSKLNLNPDILVEPTFKRFYPNGDLASHIIGYVSRTNPKEAKKDKVAKMVGIIGKAGIEKFYNRYLEGELGYKKVKVTAFNEEIETLEIKEPIQNRNLILSIDIRLQKYIEKLFKGKAGVAIVMGIDGEILSAGSFPEYDINMFVSGISKDKWFELISDFNHPFTNKLINGLYPPGSTIKMGVALAFLDSRKISEYTPFFCNGSIEIGKRRFRCWKTTGHGETRMKKAIRESCDVYFYEGSLKVGINKISDTLKKLGFSKKTGVDLPNEFIGIIPNKEWKEKKYNRKWYIGETVVASIGQGYDLVTPMQIARYTALLASGRLPTPHFAKKFVDKDYKPKYEYALSDIQRRKLKTIQKAMYEVCNHPKGTATAHIDTKIKIAGKTGTAQVVGIPQDEKKRMKEDELKYFSRSHAWLTTYGPYKKPKYIVTVLVEHGGHGGSAAGPIVSKIYDKLIELGYIKAGH